MYVHHVNLQRLECAGEDPEGGGIFVQHSYLNSSMRKTGQLQCNKVRSDRKNVFNVTLGFNVINETPTKTSLMVGWSVQGRT